MRILFGLGNAQLGQPESRQIFPEYIIDPPLLEHDREIEILAVIGQTHEGPQCRCRSAAESIERITAKRTGELAGPVSAEVHEYQHIAVFNPDPWLMVGDRGGGATNSSLSPRA